MSKMLSTRRGSTVTIIVDDQLRERLAQAAEENERSLGAEVRVALRAHLAPHEHEDEEEDA